VRGHHDVNDIILQVKVKEMHNEIDADDLSPPNTPESSYSRSPTPPPPPLN
jgi:hypothetical protein